MRELKPIKLKLCIIFFKKCYNILGLIHSGLLCNIECFPRTLPQHRHIRINWRLSKSSTSLSECGWLLVSMPFWRLVQVALLQPYALVNHCLQSAGSSLSEQSNNIKTCSFYPFRIRGSKLLLLLTC